ncbi:MAG TPA: deoxyribose-phosphate aldolase [Aliidongia sp.]|nr:deoxyribose-phosphate aldolase [Aliidongia sp.]
MSDAGKLRRIAQRLLPLLDLDSEDRGEGAVRALCRAARTPAGNVATICVPPGFVSLAKGLLAGTAVPVTAKATPAEIEAAAVADEIELILSEPPTVEAVREIRRACGRATLKLVLETGRLDGPAIRAAADAAIAGGADFLVTSSGLVEPGASQPAAASLLEAIGRARLQRRWIGFKAAGGIRTLSDAQPYLALYDRVMGEGSASAAGFRIGGSMLLNDIMIALGLPSQTGDFRG